MRLPDSQTGIRGHQTEEDTSNSLMFKRTNSSHVVQPDPPDGTQTHTDQTGQCTYLVRMMRQ